ncbi:molybdopterin-dependent oxidoreductase [Aggregatilinea lenta]|uniref:molybdopterin-dependent oxidoreductase n=1 Tax=Aggregatilinea lenta TaxID=913108 RepID=UPI000E5BE0CE|nr:molybdopterin-dependent oxidoreductase [Aggregatilinea lenta]
MTNLTRRNFIKIGAAGTATVILAGCDSDERWVKIETYVRSPEEEVAGNPKWFATTCRQCGAGCGVIARVINGRAVKLEGNPEHPVNRGALCARGQAGLQVLYNPDRVQTAARQDGRATRNYEPIPWNTGINQLAEALNSAGSRVAVWVGTTTPGHLVDLFTRFTDAVGAPAPVRYDLNAGFGGYAPLSNASEGVLGQAGLPTYGIGDADFILSFGAEFLGSWISAAGYGREYGEFRSKRIGKARGYLVQLEPRMSNTAASADRWIPVHPGTEVLVAQAILRLIADGSAGSQERRDLAGQFAGDVDLEEIAEQTDISVETLQTLATTFANASRPLAIPGTPVTGRDNATEAVNAINALNVVAGNLGGSGGISLTPAAPINALAAPTYSNYQDAADLIAAMTNGEIDVLLVHGANPAFELPASAGFQAALENVGLVVSFASIVDETALYADLLLPDRVYLEGWGYDVATPGFQGLPIVSGQQPVVTPLYDNVAAADVLLTAAKSVSGAASALPWTDEVAFIKDIVTQLPEAAYPAEGDDVKWAYFLQHGGWWPAEAPESEAPEVSLGGPVELGPAMYEGDPAEYPYFLHLYMSPILGDGSGASQPWLQGTPDPMTTIAWQTWVEINPRTAEELDLDDGDIVRVSSPNGTIEAPIYRYPAIRPDTLAIPIGQGHEALSRYAKDRGANPVQLVSGTPGNDGNIAWSTVRVKLEKQGENKPLAVFESTVDQGEDVHIPF